MNHHVKNGNSRVVPSYLFRQKGGVSCARKFDDKYRDKGGIEKLKKMALEDRLTLQAMGDHFGVSREYIRQVLFIYGIRKGKRIGSATYEIMNRRSEVERRMKNLYKWIIDHNMLIGQFSKESGIPASRLSCLLTGKTNPSYTDLSKIRLVTGMSFEDILSREPETNGKAQSA
jgi:hypothetical protein